MSLREDVAYRYDGTQDGMLCCIFASYEHHELPSVILSPEDARCTLFETRIIPSDPIKADRVLKGLQTRSGGEAVDFIRLGLLTALPDKERHILLFTRMAMKHGPAVCDMLTAPHVCQLHQAIRFLQTESHHLCGFIRFTEINRTLVSMITPKNNVLPLLDPHFSDRFPEERFIIYDRARLMALMHMPGESRIIPLQELTLPAVSADELDIQRLWQRFHQTIAIEGRMNRKLQRSNLPLRYRQNITEFRSDAAQPVTHSLISSKGALSQ